MEPYRSYPEDHGYAADRAPEPGYDDGRGWYGERGGEPSAADQHRYEDSEAPRYPEPDPRRYEEPPGELHPEFGHGTDPGRAIPAQGPPAARADLAHGVPHRPELGRMEPGGAAGPVGSPAALGVEHPAGGQVGMEPAGRMEARGVPGHLPPPPRGPSSGPPGAAAGPGPIGGPAGRGAVGMGGGPGAAGRARTFPLPGEEPSLARRPPAAPASPPLPSDGVYRSRRPAVAALLGIPAAVLEIPVLMLLVDAAFGDDPLPSGVISAACLGLALPLLAVGLYAVATGAVRAAGPNSAQAWLRPPVAYLTVGLILAVAAGLAS